MKNIIIACAFVFGSSAFAGTTAKHHHHHHHHNYNNVPTCGDLVKNTEGIVTLTPITSSSNPIEAGGKVLFAAAAEGVDAGFCAAEVTVHAGVLVVKGIEEAVEAGVCVIHGAAELLGQLLNSIFGR